MSVEEPANGTCHFYLKKKKRYCRFQPPKEWQKYCPEHACILGVEGGRKRVPCPLNPSHNCYKDELDKHVKKCNITKVQKAAQEAGYYVRGINKGSANRQTAEMQQESKKVCVKDLTSAELAAMIARVDKLYEEHVDVVEEAVFEHPCVREEYCKSGEDLSHALGEQAALRKELLQQASLIGQLDDLGLLTDGHCFVEMGAGKGKLSHWIQKASKDCTNNSFLLIERSSVRYKMDAFHKQAGAESMFQRIKIDIEDLCLGCVDLGSHSNDPVIVVGKHLCGGATDMGIRCAVETLGTQKPPQSSSSSTSLSNGQPSLVVINSEQQKPVQQLHKPAQEAMSIQLLGTSENVASIGNSSLASVGTVSPAAEVSESSCISSMQEDESAGDQEHKAMNTEKAEDKKDTNRKNNGPADLEHEPPTKAQKLTDNKCRQKLPRGIMIALCCHHFCTWDAYLGQDFMHSCGVTSQEFDLLTRLSSWATCARVTARSAKNSRRSHENNSGQMKTADPEDNKAVQEGSVEAGSVVAGRTTEEHDAVDLINSEASKHLREQLNVSEREAIGWKCKRIIDTGRLHYLRSKGMTCCLRRYISEEFTPENVVLLAYL